MIGWSFSGWCVPPVAVPPRAAADDPAHPGSMPADRKPEALQGFHILIVDDEAEARALIRASLEIHGAVVSAADRAAAALLLLTEEHPPRRFDALVSDIAMPERDGFALVSDLRAWERPRALRMPALALSGHTARADRRRALECGFDRHLSKPVDVGQLVAAILDLGFRSHRTH